MDSSNRDKLGAKREYEQRRSEVARAMANRWLNGNIEGKIVRTEYKWITIRRDFSTFINDPNGGAANLIREMNIPGTGNLPLEYQGQLEEFVSGKLMEFATVVKQGNFSQKQLLMIESNPVLQRVIENQKKVTGQDVFTRMRNEIQAARGHKSSLLRLVRDPMAWMYLVGGAGMVAKQIDEEDKKNETA